MLLERKRTEDNPRAAAAAIANTMPSPPSYDGVNDVFASQTDAMSAHDTEYFFGEVTITSSFVYHYDQ